MRSPYRNGQHAPQQRSEVADQRELLAANPIGMGWLMGLGARDNRKHNRKRGVVAFRKRLN